MNKGLKGTIHRRNEERRWEMFGLSSSLSRLVGGNFLGCRARPVSGCEPNLPFGIRLEWETPEQWKGH